jgi:hypothetical protein
VGVEVQLHSFLNSVLERISKTTPGTLSVEGCVGPSADMNPLEKTENSCLYKESKHSSSVI